jgi:hypothetical protein
MPCTPESGEAVLNASQEMPSRAYATKCRPVQSLDLGPRDERAKSMAATPDVP